MMFPTFTIQYLSNINQEKEKNILLEPLSCIFRMILLNYKDEGVKISIYNNSITYNENTYYQGILRNINGDTRNDLHNLYNPFLKCFEWYPITNENDLMSFFYQKCKIGLEKLTECYDKSSIIHHTLSHYCLLFKNVIDNQPIDKIDDKESPLLDEFKTIWDNDELIIIYKMIKYLDKTNDEDEKNIYLNNIDSIITMKEKKIHEYIQKYSTSYN